MAGFGIALLERFAPGVYLRPLGVGKFDTGVARGARSLARDAGWPDDVVQVTFENALHDVSGFLPGMRLGSWSFRIMRNAWIDEVRARAPQEGIEACRQHAACKGPSTTAARPDLAAVRRATDTLPENQRCAPMRVCGHGPRHRAAAVLGATQGTVLGRLSWAPLALARVT